MKTEGMIVYSWRIVHENKTVIGGYDTDFDWAWAKVEYQAKYLAKKGDYMEVSLGCRTWFKYVK